MATVRGWVDSVVRFQRWRFHDPDGLAQDVILKLLGIVGSNRYRATSSFRTFVHAVAARTCIDAYRSERLRSNVVAVDPADLEVSDGRDTPEDEQVQRERCELVRFVFQRLSERCRQLWLLVYRDGLAAREIATRLGISTVNVRVRVHRCLTEARAIAAERFPGSAP